MKSDIQIAQSAKMKNIYEIGKKAGFFESEIEPHGYYKAKINLSSYDRLKNKPDGKLMLVTSINPTPQGEGKTTTTVALGQGLSKLGKKAFITIREPSLGPCMGLKGGAAGGGYSQLLPMEDINLHFIGEMHVISATHNLLSAMLDNHIHQGNELGIDVREIVWRRVIDMNDRTLRKITVGLGEGINGLIREDGFDITAASEVMAVLCLSTNLSELKKRLSNIIVAYNYKGKPVTAKDLKAHGAMTILMKDTIKPNLVQSIEGVPAFVHGGPFANIAHGCNSLIATKLALKVSDYVVTEAGFGADLGAEKFFDIKCRIGNLKPSAAVIVVTTRALIRQGYGSGQKDYEALKKGLANLEKHIQNVKYFGVPVIVSINKFDGDTDKHFNIIKEKCSHLGVNAVVSEGHKLGGNGTKELAKEVIKLCGHKSKIKFLYKTNQSIKHKIETIAHKIYGAEKIRYNPEAERDIEHLEKLGLNKLPICMAKTQYSLSDDPKKLGKPENFQINIRQVKVNAGAGFIVAYTSNIMTMPGLPKHPAAENMDISNTGKITGLF